MPKTNLFNKLKSPPGAKDGLIESLIAADNKRKLEMITSEQQPAGV